MGEGLRDVRGAHKNMVAVIRVSVPVMIISLENGEYIGEMLMLYPTIAMAEVLWCVCARCQS
jgi:hypothetical protein